MAPRRVVIAGGGGAETGAVGHEFDSGSGIFFAAVEMTRMPMVVVDPNQDDTRSSSSTKPSWR